MPDSTTKERFVCNVCGEEMTVRNKARLLSTGICMLVPLGLAFVFPVLWAPAIILSLTGGYLLAWAIIGKGRWCRNCKRFNVLHHVEH
jgi:hypothetical protein